jgi:hypothetical protein
MLMFKDLGELFSVATVGGEEKLSCSANLLDQMTRATGFRSDLRKEKRLAFHMGQVAKFELRLPAAIREILCVEHKKSGQFAAANVVLALAFTWIPGR